jgi:hypothetical protein
MLAYQSNLYVTLWGYNTLRPWYCADRFRSRIDSLDERIHAEKSRVISRAERMELRFRPEKSGLSILAVQHSFKSLLKQLIS